MLTGRLVATSSEQTLGAALTRLIARSGEPIIRKGVDAAMRLMGEQFVTGRTIEEALNASREREAHGFRYSYDMLGEAAMTADDAARYLADYERAVHAIGHAAQGRGIYEGPGISVKLSALHPRYQRIKRERVMSELLPRIMHLAALASPTTSASTSTPRRRTGSTFRSTSSRRSASSPTCGLERPRLRRPGLREACAFVVDWLVDLARRTQRRLMVRLVKGAYWDSEIKRAQVEGWTVSRSSPGRSTPTSAISPAPGSCSRRRTRSFRNSPPTTRRRSPPS